MTKLWLFKAYNGIHHGLIGVYMGLILCTSPWICIYFSCRSIRAKHFLIHEDGIVKLSGLRSLVSMIDGGSRMKVGPATVFMMQYSTCALVKGHRSETTISPCICCVQNKSDSSYLKPTGPLNIPTHSGAPLVAILSWFVWLCRHHK